MANFDLTNLAVKIVCPNNVVKTDDTDLPSVLVYIPKFKNSDVLTGGNDSTHPAFIVNGVEIPGFYYGKYQAKVYNSVAYSLPGEDPTASINFDTARARCEAKGAGWHLSTNAEWAAIALWCKKNGFLPYGNNNYGKTMSNSSLVDCTVYSPNHSGKRTHSIDRLTPHCVVGQLSAETIGACFPKGRNASCNYGIGYDGRVCLIVDECNRSWCSSSNANDQRAITIECASDKAEPYAMKSAVYEKLIKLCADICKRNGKTKVLWLGSKEKALAYEPKANEIVLTAHRWFANKSCPGDWLYSRYGELADRINALLGSTDSGNSGGNNTPSGGSGVKYYVQTGAYKQKANADAQLKKVKAAGFDAILKQSGGFYKVQTGAYSKKENANAEVAKLKAKGFDAIVTTNGGSAAGSANSEIKVGDVVQFSGGPHYGSAAASTAAGTPKAGPAKVTRIVKGAKHPYHIVHTDGQSSVYGWVNAANVSK